MLRAPISGSGELDTGFASAAFWLKSRLELSIAAGFRAVDFVGDFR